VILPRESEEPGAQIRMTMHPLVQEDPIPDFGDDAAGPLPKASPGLFADSARDDEHEPARPLDRREGEDLIDRGLRLGRTQARVALALEHHPFAVEEGDDVAAIVLPGGAQVLEGLIPFPVDQRVAEPLEVLGRELLER
jgi:hypothetical protein